MTSTRRVFVLLIGIEKKELHSENLIRPGYKNDLKSIFLGMKQ